MSKPAVEAHGAFQLSDEEFMLPSAGSQTEASPTTPTLAAGRPARSMPARMAAAAPISGTPNGHLVEILTPVKGDTA
jgi:hypothetical protein